MPMALRLVVAAACVAMASLGCDEPMPMGTTPATAPSTVADAAANPSPATAPRERIALGVIPLTIEVPKGWLLKPGDTGKIVLHGRLTSGAVDVLLGTGISIKNDALELMVKESTKPTTDRRQKVEVVKRDGMTIVQTIAPQLPPNMPPPSDPELVPMGWSVQCIVSDGSAIDLPVYELTFLGLSQAMFERDEAWLRQMVSTIRHEAAANPSAATQPAVP